MKIQALALALLWPLFAAAAPLSLTAPAGTVNFLAVGTPGMLKVHGTGTGGGGQMHVEGNQLRGSISFPLEQLDTGISLRTRHMKEKYLETAKYPDAKLTILDATLDPTFAQTLSNAGEKPFRGKLALHGQEKEVSGSYKVEKGQVQAKFPLTLSDYKIDVPKYLGVTVADKVDVDVNFTFHRD